MFRELAFHPEVDLKILTKNYKLSDDIAFRFSNRNWNCIWTPGSLSSDVLAYGPLLCHDLADVPASGGISAEPQADFIRGYGRRLRHCIDCWTVADSKLVGVWSSDSHDDTWRLHVAARE